MALITRATSVQKRRLSTGLENPRETGEEVRFKAGTERCREI